MNKRTELPTAENSSNFNRVAGATCQVGTTLENLKAAVCGERAESPVRRQPGAKAQLFRQAVCPLEKE